MITSDRELLSLAAHAAGADLASGWNPLDDDGDADALASALMLKVTRPKYFGWGSSAEPINGRTAGCTVFRDGCQLAQTRRAIVMAAAEIGRMR